MTSPRDHYQPELALLVDRPPSGPQWIHELKLDGYRMGIVRSGRSVRLVSRRGTEWTHDFPEVVAAARAIGARRAVLDGELVSLSERGISDFQALQNRATVRGALAYFAFDLLALDGRDLRREPLERRKALLHDLIGDATGIIRYTEHVVGDGAEVLRRACTLGAEGIVSKRRDAPYHSGARHPDWQKIKCVKRQEFVVGGFTDPSGARVGIGSLLIGYYDGSQLRFAGKVGTGIGWTGDFGRTLRKRLGRIERRSPPFDPPPPGWLGKHAHWVQPRLVAEVEFTEWTGGGNVRHPSLRGFRTDKAPHEVVRERPEAPPRAQPVFPKIAVDKADLVRLYTDIADWALPHVVGRPLTVVRRRQPITREDALRSQCVFLHHTARDQRWVSAVVPRIAIPEKKKRGQYLWIDSARALLALVESDIVEWHVWNAAVDDVERPDRIVFDLDPGAGSDWLAVIEAAKLVRRRLADLGLESWVKTTGGKGLHVVVPFRPEHDWDAVFAFARIFAESIVREQPDKYTLSFSKSDRARRVLIDYKRNYRTSIAVAGFSMRARPDGTMSVPLRWSEVTARLRPDAFTVRNIRDRLRRLKSDPWEGYWKAKQLLRVDSQSTVVSRQSSVAGRR